MSRSRCAKLPVGTICMIQQRYPRLVQMTIPVFVYKLYVSPKAEGVLVLTGRTGYLCLTDGDREGCIAFQDIDDLLKRAEHGLSSVQ